MTPEDRGNEAAAAFQQAIGAALSIGKGIAGSDINGDLAAFQAAAKEYVAAQAVFTLACADAMKMLGMKRTVRDFAAGFLDD